MNDECKNCRHLLTYGRYATQQSEDLASNLFGRKNRFSGLGHKTGRHMCEITCIEGCNCEHPEKCEE